MIAARPNSGLGWPYTYAGWLASMGAVIGAWWPWSAFPSVTLALLLGVSVVAVFIVLAAPPWTRSLNWRLWAVPVIVSLAGLAWSAMAVDRAVDARWPEDRSGEVRDVSGTIVGFVTHDEFGVTLVLDVDPQAAMEDGAWPRRVQVRWYRAEVIPNPGERWQWPLALTSTRSPINFVGGDAERAWLVRRIDAFGRVAGAGKRLSRARGYPAWRDGWRHRIASAMNGVPGGRWVLALGVADRSALTSDDWRRLRQTGTAHLVAISGLHVGLAAMFGYWLGRFGLAALPVLRRCAFSWRWPWLASLSVALAYAAAAGFTLPTRRALLMLVVAVGAMMARRVVRPWHALQVALLVVLAVQPLSPLSGGFWLSFAAVGVLLASSRSASGRRSALQTLCRAQWSLGMLMLPLSMAWVGVAGLLSFPANLAAVPWVSVLVVPLTLLGVGVGGAPGDALLEMAARAMQWLMWGLDHMRQWSKADDGIPAAPAASILVAVIAGVCVLLPSLGRARRWAGMAWLVAMMSVDRPGAVGRAELNLLDVGQGQAAIWRTPDADWLLDTGPGDGDRRHSVDRSLHPAHGGRAPARLILSHGDLDHAGGVGAVTAHHPGLERWMPAPVEPGFGPCRRGTAWVQSDGTSTRVLHPGAWLPDLGNDSSCVLMAEIGGRRWLFPGDIGADAEAHLLVRELSRADLVVVPHHGSRSSSSAAFVNRVSPDLALVAAGHRNRWSFPVPAVRDRYRDAEARLLVTGDCGGIRVRLSPDGTMRWAAARDRRPARWRWPAPNGCLPGSTVVPR